MKIKEESEWRVEVYPRAGYRGIADRADCEQIVRDIKRHVDDVNQCYINCDTIYRCSFCNYEWEEYTAKDEKDDAECKEGMPVCCEKAQEEWLATEALKEGEMGTGIEEEAPHEVKVAKARQAVELERGDMEYADTYFLAKLILWGGENEKLVAGAEWQRRTGKDFPYHPSFKRDTYPINKLTKH